MNQFQLQMNQFQLQMNQLQFRSSNLLWLFLSACVFVVFGFFDPNEGGLKSGGSFWSILDNVVRHEYSYGSNAVIAHLIGHAVILAIPAAALGWIVQALIVVVATRFGLRSTTTPPVTLSRKRRLLLTAGILVLGFTIFQAVDYFFTPEDVKRDVIHNGMPYDHARRVLDGNGAFENNKKYLGDGSTPGRTGPLSDRWGLWTMDDGSVVWIQGYTGKASTGSLWHLPDGTRVWLTANIASGDQSKCWSIYLFPPGVDVWRPNGRERRVESLTLSDHQKPLPSRVAWALSLIGCLGAGIYSLLSQASLGYKLAVSFGTSFGVVAYLFFNYPKPFVPLMD